jgi:hypothetical protein
MHWLGQLLALKVKEARRKMKLVRRSDGSSRSIRKQSVSCRFANDCGKQKENAEMKDIIRRGLFFLAVLLTLWTVFDSATPGHAQQVCLNRGLDNSLRCDYSNMQQCRMAASGGLGYCVSNPFASSASYLLNSGNHGFAPIRPPSGHVRTSPPRIYAPATSPVNGPGGVCDHGDNPMIC